MQKISAKNFTILVVEDEQPLAEAIRTKLEIVGFDVVTARSVKQALGYLEDIKHIDAIWLDHYLLGKEDGLRLVEQMKNSEGWKSIPIFVVTNTATPDKQHMYIALGITKYYTKAEFRLDDIISDIKDLLEFKSLD